MIIKGTKVLHKIERNVLILLDDIDTKETNKDNSKNWLIILT